MRVTRRAIGDDQLVCKLCYAGAWVAPVPFLVYEAHTVLFANDAAVRAFGYRDAWDVIGLGVESLVHPDVLPAALTRLDLVTKSSHSFPATPAKILTADGGAAHVQVSVFPITVNGNTLAAVEFEISSWPQPAPKWPPPPEIGALGPALGRALLDASPTPIMIQDVDTILFANKAARDHLGSRVREDLEGKPIMSIVHPDGLFAAMQRVAFAFATRQHLTSVPTKLRCADGRVLHVTADAYPIAAAGSWAAVLVARSMREA